MQKKLSRRQITEICRDYRKNMTRAEAILWACLRNWKLDRLKFLRQHKIIYGYSGNLYQFFILDFYCDEKKLAIEIDGSIHEAQQKYDEWRTLVLNERGIMVLRIRNEEVSDLDEVLKKIREACHNR